VRGFSSSFGIPAKVPMTQRVPREPESQTGKMDKIAGLREILALDAKKQLGAVWHGMELAARGETAGALEEFDTLLRRSRLHRGVLHGGQTLSAAGGRLEGDGAVKAGSAARRGPVTAML